MTTPHAPALPWGLPTRSAASHRRDLATALAVAVVAHAALLFAQPHRAPVPIKPAKETPVDHTMTVTPVKEEIEVELDVSDEARAQGGGGGESRTFDPSELLRPSETTVEIPIDARQIVPDRKPQPIDAGWDYSPPSLNPAVGPSDGPSLILDVAKLDKAPEATFKIAPQFPREVQRETDHATVRVQFVVLANGGVTSIRVISASHRGLEDSVERALSRWKFKPGWKNNQRVATRMEQVFHFKVGE